MKKILSLALLGILLFAGFPAAAQHAPKGVKSAQVTRRVQQQKRQQQLAANKQVLKSIPRNAKIRVWFTIPLVETPVYYATTIRVFCPALILDYKEANGLGNATIAIQKKCADKADDKAWSYEDFAGVLEFNVNLTTPTDHPDDFYIYDFGRFDEDLELLTTNKGSMYIYHLSVPSSNKEGQDALRELFPNKKSFITAEKAAQALSVMK